MPLASRWRMNESEGCGIESQCRQSFSSHGGPRSTEEAFSLCTQRPRARISALPWYFLSRYFSPEIFLITTQFMDSIEIKPMHGILQMQCSKGQNQALQKCKKVFHIMKSPLKTTIVFFTWILLMNDCLNTLGDSLAQRKHFHPAARGSNPDTAEIFSLYCLVGGQYWDWKHLVPSNGFHKCS